MILDTRPFILWSIYPRRALSSTLLPSFRNPREEHERSQRWDLGNRSTICPTVFAEFACRSKQIQTKTMTTHGTSITMSIKGGEEEEDKKKKKKKNKGREWRGGQEEEKEEKQRKRMKRRTRGRKRRKGNITNRNSNIGSNKENKQQQKQHKYKNASAIHKLTLSSSLSDQLWFVFLTQPL